MFDNLLIIVNNFLVLLIDLIIFFKIVSKKNYNYEMLI